MYKRYFRKKDPEAKPDEIEWIEMTGQEFYRFVNSPMGEGRYFIDMENVVLEATKEEVKTYRAKKGPQRLLKRAGRGLEHAVPLH